MTLTPAPSFFIQNSLPAANGHLSAYDKELAGAADTKRERKTDG